MGYETTSADARIVAILHDGTEYAEIAAVPEVELRLPPNATVEIVLDRTPFYAEGGGQVGDHGALRVIRRDDPAADTAAEPVVTIIDTQKPVGGLIVHRATLHGRIAVGDVVRADVDAERRARTMRNHTGTHLLHRALRNVVGPSARQAGSLVSPDYLRFDFPFDRPLAEDEKRAIEGEVRRIIREDRSVFVEYMTMPEAIAAGADAFFDEKYGDLVRTVRVEGYSHELCGGTHCRASGQIGSFVIVGERSIGTGVRRIEAYTGDGADAFLAARLATLERATAAAGAANPDALAERIAALQEELRETKRRVRAGGGGVPKPGELAGQATEVAPGIRMLSYAGPFESIETMKGAAKDVRGILGSGVVALGLDGDEPHVFVTVSDDLVGRLSAGELVKAAMAVLGGRGGGRPEMAQGKGGRRENLPAALDAVRDVIATTLSGAGSAG